MRGEWEMAEAIYLEAIRSKWITDEDKRQLKLMKGSAWVHFCQNRQQESLYVFPVIKAITPSDCEESCK